MNTTPSNAHSIVARSVALTAFLGSSTSAHHKPTYCTSWGAYVAKFGSFAEGSTLAHAVHGFFTNGGTKCLILNISKTHDLAMQLHALEHEVDVGIVVAPGMSDPAVHEALLAHCEKVGPRFAILDSPCVSPDTALHLVQRPRNSAHGAFYCPWLKVHDPATNQEIPQPPSGHIAGIFARMDKERGTHHAPANAVVRGAVGLTVALNQQENDILHPKGINAIRVFKKRGIRVWGANTLSASGFRQITSKRTLDMIALSIQEGTRYVEEKPNTPELQAHVKAAVTRFLRQLWLDGVLPGGEGKGFFVRCDKSLHTHEIDVVGAFVVEVGISLSRPGRFTVFRVVHQQPR